MKNVVSLIIPLWFINNFTSKIANNILRQYDHSLVHALMELYPELKFNKEKFVEYEGSALI
jgi:hypothetical protein